VAVGRKGSHLIAARRWPLLAEFSVHDSVPFFQVKAIANFLRDSYLSGEIDTVEVAYSVYVNALRQEPLLRKLLPWDGLGEDLQKFHALLPGEANSLPQDGRKLLVEPTPELLLETLLEGFFRRELFHILLEAKAAEQGARMVAMKAATDNAEALTRELQLVYNRARQASITNEILEITAGRELR
jgi:F-type H+-transporting ATPase subunit gamma